MRVQFRDIDAGEVAAAEALVIVAQVAEEVHFLERGAQAHCGGFQPLVFRLVAFEEHAQAHEPDHFGAAHHVLIERVPIVALLFQVHGHAAQEGLDVLAIDRIPAHRVLETVKDRVQADAFIDRAPCVGGETLEQFALVMRVERVHDLVGETHESVNGMDRRTEPFVQ